MPYRAGTFAVSECSVTSRIRRAGPNGKISYHELKSALGISTMTCSSLPYNGKTPIRIWLTSESVNSCPGSKRNRLGITSACRPLKLTAKEGDGLAGLVIGHAADRVGNHSKAGHEIHVQRPVRLVLLLEVPLPGPEMVDPPFDGIVVVSRISLTVNSACHLSFTRSVIGADCHAFSTARRYSSRAESVSWPSDKYVGTYLDPLADNPLRRKAPPSISGFTFSITTRFRPSSLMKSPLGPDRDVLRIMQMHRSEKS